MPKPLIPAYKEEIVKVAAKMEEHGEKKDQSAELPMATFEETKETSNLSGYTAHKHRSRSREMSPSRDSKYYT